MASEVKSFRSSLRRIRRELKYETCSDVIGTEVLIAARDTIARDVANALKGKIPNIAGMIRGGFLRMHTHLDLTFALDPQPASCARGGLRLLIETGFLPERKDEAVGFSPEDLDLRSDGILHLIEDDVDTGQLFLRLYLEPASEELRSPRLMEVDFSDAEEVSKQTSIMVEAGNKLIDEALPILYRITDACITNATGIWMFKHFYM